MTSCGAELRAAAGFGIRYPYPRRLEKVKFGVPLEEVCRRCDGDLPAPLLIMLLKVNKQGPYKKDVFRQPGYEAHIKTLVHNLRIGRLVNIDKYSVHTIASVLKKFLRKIPGGIFGVQFEAELYDIIQANQLTVDEKLGAIRRIISSLPISHQRLLVLLFGTFRVVSLYAESAASLEQRNIRARSASTISGLPPSAGGMTSESIGVSVAPSIFVSCCPVGSKAKLEDIVRIKLASNVITFMIDNFPNADLFGRRNYEYYARMTCRVLRLDDELIFTFPFPLDKQVLLRKKFSAKNICLAQLEALKWGLGDAVNSPEEPLKPFTSRLVRSASSHSSITCAAKSVTSSISSHVMQLARKSSSFRNAASKARTGTENLSSRVITSNSDDKLRSASGGLIMHNVDQKHALCYDVRAQMLSLDQEKALEEGERNGNNNNNIGTAGFLSPAEYGAVYHDAGGLNFGAIAPRSPSLSPSPAASMCSSASSGAVRSKSDSPLSADIAVQRLETYNRIMQPIDLTRKQAERMKTRSAWFLSNECSKGSVPHTGKLLKEGGGGEKVDEHGVALLESGTSYSI